MTEEYPDCPNCGYTMTSTPCSFCAEKKTVEEKARRFEAECLGGERAWRDFKFENFVKTKFNNEALEACRNFDARTENAYLSGPTGAGKTHLATAALRGSWNPRVGRINWSTPEMLRNIRSQKDAAAEDSFIERLVNQSLIIIDDIGTEKVTDWSVPTIWEIINRRWASGKGGMIISSNLSLNDLSSRMGEDRITSRIAGMCKIFDLSGERDWRTSR